ncbi:hypothetical protein GMO_02380 [Gluconobacter morbifer G707]|uniref:Uncharacterized protein n=1 Tax=Gluconobacter morbifer G707 TaxID=1088869 RepID=G6XFH3_9PROT|nr:hypothetical protein GMO_02380 [Gluconobacter morbifer G707]
MLAAAQERKRHQQGKRDLSGDPVRWWRDALLPVPVSVP